MARDARRQTKLLFTYASSCQEPSFRQCEGFDSLFGDGPTVNIIATLDSMAGGGFDQPPLTLVCFVGHANLMSFAGRQKDIRPDAPWLEFLDVRYRLLVAYQRHERGCRETKKSPTAVTRVELRTAFLQLSGALDQVTVPVEVRFPL